MNIRDIAIIIIGLLVLYLVFKDIFGKRKVELIDASNAGITMTPDGITFNKPVNFTNTVNANKDLYVGTGDNKWHMRDTRLGITGKFDFVPGFTKDFSVNDNWIRLLKYDSKIYTEGWGDGISCNNLSAMNIVNTNRTLRIRARKANEYLQAGDGWDARISNNPGLWEEWYIHH